MANQKVAARLQVGPNCLLFFIDETGHETFADKNYPVFARLAVTISKSAMLPTGNAPLEITTGSMIKRYTGSLRRVSPEPNEVAFLHEASNRLDDAIEQHFGGTVAQINGKMIPVHKGLIEKSHGLPELEVADFIMHAAGRRAVQFHCDPATPFGKDFIVVFQSFNPTIRPVIGGAVPISQAIPAIAELVANRRFATDGR